MPEIDYDKIAQQIREKAQYGMLEPGNIDLQHRPRVQNADGTVSSVRSIGVNIDGKEVLIPTVSDDGKIWTNAQAIENYRKTGKHLGKFDTPEHSTAYGIKVHEDQAAMTGAVDYDAIAAKVRADAQKQPESAPEPRQAPLSVKGAMANAMTGRDSADLSHAFPGPGTGMVLGGMVGGPPGAALGAAAGEAYSQLGELATGTEPIRTDVDSVGHIVGEGVLGGVLGGGLEVGKLAVGAAPTMFKRAGGPLVAGGITTATGMALGERPRTALTQGALVAAGVGASSYRGKLGEILVDALMNSVRKGKPAAEGLANIAEHIAAKGKPLIDLVENASKEAGVVGENASAAEKLAMRAGKPAKVAPAAESAPASAAEKLAEKAGKPASAVTVKTAKPPAGPTPDRVLRVGLGAHGQVEVVFPDANHADLFSAVGRSRAAMRGNPGPRSADWEGLAARFKTDRSGIYKLAQEYREQVMAAAREAKAAEMASGAEFSRIEAGSAIPAGTAKNIEAATAEKLAEKAGKPKSAYEKRLANVKPETVLKKSLRGMYGLSEDEALAVIEATHGDPAMARQAAELLKSRAVPRVPTSDEDLMSLLQQSLKGN